MFNRSKEKKNSKTASTTKNPSTQEWMPIKDIQNNLLYRKDNHIVAAIRVQPVNLNLLSIKERIRKVKRLEEALSGLNYEYQIISIAKPVDLDSYIMKLEQMRRDTDNVIKKKLLSIYSNQAVAKASSGEALERHFYILIAHQLGKNPKLDEQVILQQATQLAAAMSSAELLSSVCGDSDLRTLQFIFSNPAQAAFERAPIDRIFLPTMLFAEEDET
ncbi:hypothetical protein [Paenibacillus agilis]|uniref:TraC-like domain-containing protein n=1 Tax=Paenibacillus agilis TaxID=3020863 RepID=A0A559ID97_9BACL|nr:hypothetical protein [Paenibacillus agilis]TVX85625.1 hypothetical protein FPZ44_25065 [Paenibacillus agilis]